MMADKTLEQLVRDAVVSALVKEYPKLTTVEDGVVTLELDGRDFMVEVTAHDVTEEI